MDVAFLAIIVAVLAVLLLKRKSKQLPYATYQTTIEATLHAVFVARVLLTVKIFSFDSQIR